MVGSGEIMNGVSQIKRVTLLFLGTTGAGPVYALEMAKALADNSNYRIQIVLSKYVYNVDEWRRTFSDSMVCLEEVDTYRRNKLSFALSLLEFWKVIRIHKAIREFGADVVYSPFPSLWDFRIFPIVSKYASVIATLHDPHPHDEIKNPFERFIQNENYRTLRYAKDIVLLNMRDVEYVQQNYGKNVWVIPHASFSYYARDIKEPHKLNYTIGFIGRIEPYKGLDLLVEAFSGINNSKLHLLIAGNGTIDGDTLSKINDNQRIELINRYIKDEEFSGLLNRMDFVVLPYKRASQSGVIPLVFSQGKTVVVTNVGALSEQVPDDTGVVVDDATSDSIKEAIVDLYHKPERIFQMGRSAFRYAKQELTWAHSAELLMKIIENED
jgi:glycosyltransferase involved in cell wall biosynthesis